jgi:hypothetical protein
MMKKTIFWIMLALMLISSQFVLGADPFPGKPPLTPAWALKHWAWEDNTNTRTAVENLVNDYTSRNIPVAAVIIDSPWETKYNTFVWDTSRYPNPQEMIDNFHNNGVKVILWLTAFVNTDSPDYSYVKSQGYTVNNGQDFTWWKGTGVHIDHTNPNAKAWLHSKMDNVLNMGIDGWKTDEGADKVSDPVQTSIGSMSKDDFEKYYYADFYDYTVSKNPNGIITARAYSWQGGVGASIPKDPICWQGDFAGDFTGLNNQKNDVYESAIRGYGAPGVEVGGYNGAVPTKNSLIRYAQFGALTPLMENGGSNGGNAQHLAWYWDTQTVDIYRYFAVLHNELVPYNFSYIVDAHTNGGSILKSCDKTKNHHLLGDQLFVSILTTDTTSKTVDFPSGAKWIDYWSESVTYDGGTNINYSVPLDRFPIFIKAGAIIPLDVKNNITGHGDSTYDGKTTLAFYPYGQSSFTYHRPTGEGTAYEDIIINVNESAGTIGVDGVSSLNYKLGATGWSYDATNKYVIIDKTGTDFTITISGLKGYSTVATPTPAPTPTPLSGVINNLTVNDTGNAADWSIRTNIQNDNQQYGDRTFTFTTMPTSVAGCDWIRTANDSKTYTGTTLVSFTVNSASDVYVAHNDLITAKPSWLSDWTLTADDLVNNEATPRTFSLYKKNFTAGSNVSLGNNGSTTEGMYVIIVKPVGSTATPTSTPTATPTPTPGTAIITNLSVKDTGNAADWSIQTNLQSGNQQFGDRTFILSTVPSSVAGGDWIRTANDSKVYTGDPLVTFTVTAARTVYVAWDTRKAVPKWLSGWADTGQNLVNNEATPSTFRLWSKSYAANASVSLGPVGQNLDVNMYTIIVK